VSKALDRLQREINEAGATVEVEPLPVVTGDEPELTQLFENLLDNAVKYRSKETHTQIRVSSERAAAEWIIRVSDNGLGIDPQYHRRIFDIFQRLHSRSDYPGTGIGLAICKKVVEVHGGRIWADSDANGGSTFSFTLPAE
jgi:light-regulated signal transduction histidine kinase (bacteriophytochrome)